MLAAADDGANGGKGGDSDAVVVALPAAHAAPIRPVDGAALLPESPPPVAWQRPRVSVETWRRRAAIAWRLLVSAAAVHTLGLCLVIPALWLPWSTSSFTREAYNGSSMTEVTVSLVVAALQVRPFGRGRASQSSPGVPQGVPTALPRTPGGVLPTPPCPHLSPQMTMTCSSTDGTPVSGCYSTTLMSPAVVGGFFLVLAAVFVLCAGAVCAAAAVHLRALAVKGAMPPAPDGGDGEGGDAGDCGCYASVPAINGLGAFPGAVTVCAGRVAAAQQSALCRADVAPARIPPRH